MLNGVSDFRYTIFLNSATQTEKFRVKLAVATEKIQLNSAVTTEKFRVKLAVTTEKLS